MQHLLYHEMRGPVILHGKCSPLTVQLYLDHFIYPQYLGESLSNEQKATVFEQTVPCHNNISLCCMQLKSYGESAQFARNVSRFNPMS